MIPLDIESNTHKCLPSRGDPIKGLPIGTVYFRKVTAVKNCIKHRQRKIKMLEFFFHFHESVQCNMTYGTIWHYIVHNLTRNWTTRNAAPALQHMELYY